jgi:hypothetical protein
LVDGKVTDVNFDCLTDDLFFIEQQINAAGAHSRQLTEHNVLRYALENLFFSIHGRIHQHVHCFFEGRSQQRAAVDAVDAVSINRH